MGHKIDEQLEASHNLSRQFNAERSFKDVTKLEVKKPMDTVLHNLKDAQAALYKADVEKQELTACVKQLIEYVRVLGGQIADVQIVMKSVQDFILDSAVSTEAVRAEEADGEASPAPKKKRVRRNHTPKKKRVRRNHTPKKIVALIKGASKYFRVSDTDLSELTGIKHHTVWNISHGKSRQKIEPASFADTYDYLIEVGYINCGNK